MFHIRLNKMTQDLLSCYNAKHINNESNLALSSLGIGKVDK